MAVKASQFFKHHRNKDIAIMMLSEILLAVVGGLIAWSLYNFLYFDTPTLIFITISSMLAIQIGFTPILFKITAHPFKIVSQAIAHVSDDPVQTAPPDINKPGYEKDGIKTMVQTVYELTVASHNAKNNVPINNSPLDNEFYKTLFDNTPCGIIALNNKGEVIMANKIAPTHPTSDGKIVMELLFEQSNSLEQWLKDMQINKLKQTKVWHRIADHVPGEDGRRIFDVIAYYKKEGKQGIETILVTIDRTEAYGSEEEDADFIAIAAHELRGPITVIRGYLDIIGDELNPLLSADQQELIDRLQVSAEQLSGYINNVLNVSRYDRNHLKLHLHEEKPIDIINALLPALALRAKTKKRQLEFHIPDNLPAVAADRSSLSEVLSNLIDNAIKYSKPNGTVIVSMQPKGKFVETTIQDFGIGMPNSVVGNLFTKFYRSHRSRQQVSGTGLGLYICKAIVESHGGRIWAKSTEGQGSTFGFTIPIYSTVADKLSKNNNGNEGIIERSDGWIKNHSMFRR